MSHPPPFASGVAPVASSAAAVSTVHHRRHCRHHRSIITNVLGVIIVDLDRIVVPIAGSSESESFHARNYYAYSYKRFFKPETRVPR